MDNFLQIKSENDDENLFPKKQSSKRSSADVKWTADICADIFLP